MKIGSMVVSRPDDIGRLATRPGIVAVVHIYGERGGFLGTTTIDERNAREAIARLTAFLPQREETT